MAIRALHFIQQLSHDGVGTWVTQMLHRLDREQVAIDVVVQNLTPGAREDEARAAGATVLRCPHPTRPLRYARQVRHILQSQGPYGVVHVHMGHWSAYVLRLAHQAGVPVRIAHSQVATDTTRPAPAWLRRNYEKLMQHWLSRDATHCWAVSDRAGASLFGSLWPNDSRCGLFTNAIDLAPLRQTVNRAAVRAELALPANAVVIGHVGRFAEQKNHALLLTIFAEAVRLDPRAWLLLVGEGPLQPAIEQQAAQLGVADRVTFAGSRADVARLLLGAMDVFALPSRNEGLPRVGLEAQAAGLVVCAADTITPQLAVVPELVRWHGLDEAPAAWARTLLDAAADGREQAPRQQRAIAALTAGPYDIDHSPSQLRQAYERALKP